MRVYQIARLFGVPSRDIAEALRNVGVNVKSASSKLEPICAQAFIAYFESR